LRVVATPSNPDHTLAGHPSLDCQVDEVRGGTPAIAAAPSIFQAEPGSGAGNAGRGLSCRSSTESRATRAYSSITAARLSYSLLRNSSGASDGKLSICERKKVATPVALCVALSNRNQLLPRNASTASAAPAASPIGPVRTTRVPPTSDPRAIPPALPTAPP